MARIKIDDVIDKLSSDIRIALANAVKEVIPNAEFDNYELFRAFKRAIRRKCRTWENIPDQYIEKTKID